MNIISKRLTMEVPWSTILRMPYTAFQYRHEIQYWWKRLLVAVDAGDTNIVVMGRPAVGKTVLVSELFGETRDYSWELPNTSIEVESRAIQLGEWASLVRVIPGQTGFERNKGINEAFNEHTNLEGVIYVADWGFTDVRKGVNRESFLSKGIDTLEKLRKHNLESELVDFRDVCNKIAEAHAAKRGPKWFLVAVNKADLFAGNIDDVQYYYDLEGDSNFAKIGQEMLKTVGTQHLRHGVVSICAWEKDFEWNSEIVETNIGGSENRRKLFVEMLAKIAELSK